MTLQQLNVKTSGTAAGAAGIAVNTLDNNTADWIVNNDSNLRIAISSLVAQKNEAAVTTALALQDSDSNLVFEFEFSSTTPGLAIEFAHGPGFDNRIRLNPGTSLGANLSVGLGSEYIYLYVQYELITK